MERILKMLCHFVQFSSGSAFLSHNCLFRVVYIHVLIHLLDFCKIVFVLFCVN